MIAVDLSFPFLENIHVLYLKIILQIKTIENVKGSWDNEAVMHSLDIRTEVITEHTYCPCCFRSDGNRLFVF